MLPERLLFSRGLGGARRALALVVVGLAVLAAAGCGQKTYDVITARAGTKSVDDQPSGIGTVNARVSVAVDLTFVSSKQALTVTTVDVLPGSHVTKGQSLLTIDATPLVVEAQNLTLRLNGARANLAVAQNRLAQIQGTQPAQLSSISQQIQGSQTSLAAEQANLAQEQSAGKPTASTTVSIQRIQGDILRLQGQLAAAQSTTSAADAQAQVEAAQGQVTIDQQLLAIANGQGSPTINAPIDGDVTGINVSPGQAAVAGKPLLTLVDSSQLLTTANVPIAELPNVQVGASAQLTFSSFPDLVLSGNVATVVPAATPDGLSFQVIVASANTPDHRVIPGIQSYVRINGRHQAPVAVPKIALLGADQNPSVFVVNQGYAHRRPVHVGVSDGSAAEILSGLAAGDQVVIVGNQPLDDGTRVNVTKIEEPATW